MFTGSIPALITPFTEENELDADGFQSFVDWQIKEGSNGVVPCGTTGESPTLGHEEHERVVELCVEAANGRVPVIAGAGSNSTAEAIRFSKHAEQAGADALLIVTPYYNKPTQAGLFAHFKAIHDACGLPIIIYNIPGRSVIDMTVDTMARLAELPRIQGVKDATNDLARPLETRLKIDRFFNQLSGEDATATAFLAQGGHGCISVTANVAPRACAEMHAAWAAGNISTMVDIRDRLAPLHEALFTETSPGPVKYAAKLLGKCSDFCRLPLAPISDETKAKVEDAMRHAQLIN
ncbi:MAG: 4-hydroxy-tetrahydrodipicolinate synthase [Alphaproteobacteria bacterium]|nr:4-hydroxy-tetrahydrodipicolinate synthase [Alphaproteobacteria bacterium SS10]